MRYLRIAGPLAALATGLALAAAPVSAQGHCPPGQAKKGNCEASQKKEGNRGRAADTDRGNAGKGNAGHARDNGNRGGGPGSSSVEKAARASESPRPRPSAESRGLDDWRRDDRAAGIGDRLGISRYSRIADPSLFGLPLLTDGTAYYIAGDRILRADPDDWEVLDVIRRVDARRDCPPGLAKKEPACIPPGQVGKILSRDWDRDRFVRIDDFDRFRLARPDGNWDYYIVDDTIVRVDRDTHEILSLVRVIDAVLN